MDLVARKLPLPTPFCIGPWQIASFAKPRGFRRAGFNCGAVTITAAEAPRHQEQVRPRHVVYRSRLADGIHVP